MVKLHLPVPKKLSSAGTDIRQEELQEVREVKAEQVLTLTQWFNISDLLNNLNYLKSLLGNTEDIENIKDVNGVSGYDLKWRQSRRRSMFRNTLTRFSEYTLPELYRIKEKANRISLLIGSIEKKEIILSLSPWQKGKPLIRDLITLDENEKKHINEMADRLKRLVEVLEELNSSLEKIEARLVNAEDASRILIRMDAEEQQPGFRAYGSGKIERDFRKQQYLAEFKSKLISAITLLMGIIYILRRTITFMNEFIKAIGTLAHESEFQSGVQGKL